MTLGTLLRRWARQDEQVWPSALRRNLQVIGVAAWVMVALNVLHVVVFGLLRFEDPGRDAWARQVTAAHGAMACLMVIVGGIAWRLNRQGEIPRWAHGLPALLAVVVLAWSIGLTVVDQAVSAHISPFINASVGVAIVLLLRPRTAVVLYSVAWASLAWAVGLTTSDAALQTTQRMNAASASALALLVSVLFWRHFVRAELLQRSLQASNELLQAQRAELERLATRDPLTGLLNRRAFVQRAELELERARRQGTPVAVLMVDLDHFKSINDRHGHGMGDEVLRQAAQRLEQVVRRTDCVARYGGEEFVLLLPDTPADSALQLADKLHHSLAQLVLPGLDMAVTVSIGVATVQGKAPATLEDWLHRADQALYQAKREGRNRTVEAKVVC